MKNTIENKQHLNKLSCVCLWNEQQGINVKWFYLFLNLIAPFCFLPLTCTICLIHTNLVVFLWWRKFNCIKICIQPIPVTNYYSLSWSIQITNAELRLWRTKIWHLERQEYNVMFCRKNIFKQFWMWRMLGTGQSGRGPSHL